MNAAMNASTRLAPPWRRVLLAPWQQRRNQGAMWFWYAMLAVACLIAVGMALVPKVPAGWTVTTLLAIFAFGGWIWLVNSLLVQNEPHAARLVPGHVRTLRRVFGVALLATTAVAGLIGALYGHALAAMAATLFAMLVIAWVVRLPILGAFIWIVPATNARWSKSAPFQAAVEAFTGAARDQPGLVAMAVAALLLIATAFTVRKLLQDGGARHRANYRSRQLLRALTQTGRGSQVRWAAAGQFGGRLRTLSTALYRRVLARASERRSGSVLGRSLVGLGPQLHWSGLLGAALTYGVLMLAIFWFVWGIALSGSRGLQTQLGGLWPISFGVLSFVVSSGLAARSVFHHTRREQALLALLPGMPRGAVLNRRLAWWLMAQFAVIWAFGLLFCALLLPLESRQFGWIVTLAFVCLPMCALLWRDWTTLRAPTPMTPAGPVIVAMLVAAGVVLLQLWRELPEWPFVLGGSVLTIALLAWRWQTVVASPGAFPAGRRA